MPDKYKQEADADKTREMLHFIIDQNDYCCFVGSKTKADELAEKYRQLEPDAQFRVEPHRSGWGWNSRWRTPGECLRA